MKENNVELKWFTWFDQKTWCRVGGYGIDILDAIKRYRESDR